MLSLCSEAVKISLLSVTIFTSIKWTRVPLMLLI